MARTSPHWTVRMAVLGLVLSACSPAPPPSPSPSPAARASSPRPLPEGPALVALREGDLEGARRLSRQAAAARPDDPEAHREVAEVEYAAGEYEAAAKAAAEALRLSGGRDPRALLTAIRVEVFNDPAKAEALGRRLFEAGDPDSPGNRILLADLILFRAASRGLRGPAARDAAREAREALGSPGDGSTLGDYEAVLGNSYLLEGDLPEARRHLARALREGPGMSDRVTDVTSAMAWVDFQLGDGKAVAEDYGRALAALRKAGVQDAFQFLPKWENYQLLRLAFAGEPTSVAAMGTLAPLRRELARRGYSDMLSFREDREQYTALADAWERGDYGQAFYLLAWKTLPLPDDPEGVPHGPVMRGEKRLEPACFYRLTVSVPSHDLFRPVFLGRVAEKAGRPDLARYWYRLALEGVPGNRILRERLASLPSGEAPVDLGAPGAAATLRILRRFAEKGWAAPLFDGLQGLQARGTTLVEFDRWVREGDPRFHELARSLDRAVGALDRGARVPEEPLPSPIPHEEWTHRAAFGPLVLHREDRLWLLTGGRD